MGRKILIFGNFPFNIDNEFIDTNHFALYFARNGDEVDFVTPPAYCIDLFIPFISYRRAILKNGISSGIEIEKNLRQYTPMTPLPIRNNFLLGSGLNLSLFAYSFNLSSLSRKEYDICITSQGFMLLWSRYVRAKKFIYRYNDLLEGFLSHPEGLKRYEEVFIRDRNPIILTVNKRLLNYLKDKYPDFENIKILPNGVDIELFLKAEPDRELLSIKKQKAVFCGGIDFWVDIELLYEAAKTLKDIVFVLIGPAKVNIERIKALPNVIYLGARRYKDIPSLLKGCDIGLIPFKRDRLTEYVEKPLKYYEYLAAGLPVIATGLSESEEKNQYFRNYRDKKLFIEAIEKMGIISHSERMKIADSVRECGWNRIFERLESFI
ncbi:MAG: glycosyltransferase [Myxococcota bacterium]